MTAATTPSYGTRSSLRRVYEAMDAAGRAPKHHGLDNFTAKCPSHDDNRASLSVSWVDERGGMTKLHCHGCTADQEEILQAVGLGLSDRFDQPLPPRTSASPRKRTSTAPAGNRLGPLPKRLTTDPEPLEPEIIEPRHIARKYDYVDEQEQLLGRAIRYEWTTTVRREKEFGQERPDGRGGWEPKTPTRKVLRHLPAVIDAIANGREVWICEGEKDDEAVNQVLPRKRGVATTNLGGAGNFGDLGEQLRDAHVVTVVDWDGAGYRRAAEIYRKQAGVSMSVRAVLPAVIAPHADATDHLQAGHGIDEFIPVSPDQLAALISDVEVDEAAQKADKAVEKTQMCADEIVARLAAAQDAESRRAVKGAQEERRFAVRWAHEAVKWAANAADRAEDAWQHLQTLARQLAELPEPLPAAARAATPTAAAAALDRAEQAQRRAQRIAEQAWELTGSSMPQTVRDRINAEPPTLRHAALPAPTPLPVTDSPEDRPQGEPGAVLPFPGERHGGGNGGGRASRFPAVKTVYERIDGQGLYEVKTRDGVPTRFEVLSLDLQILRTEIFEAEEVTKPDAEGIATIAPSAVASYVISYTHPETREQITVRIPGDRARNCDWLEDLGEMVEYDSSSKGRARVWDAINATSKDRRKVVLYESSGWRELSEHGWTYLHSGGGVTADGTVRLQVRMPRSLERIDLPDPITDPQALRALFDRDSRAMCTRLPSHVGAVLVGTAYRAVLGLTKPPTVLYGIPGTYKSAIAALTMHHFGTRWERSGASTSMSGRGATINALPELFFRCKDALFFGDDFAPDKSVEAAAQFLSSVGRMQYNQEARDRFSARLNGGRGGTLPGFPSRTTLLLTSEVKASAESGEERLNVLDLGKGDVDLAQIITLDHPASRLGRATVMASLLSWMAKDQPEHIARAAARAAAASERRRAAGADDRVAEPLAEIEAGWELVGDWLVDIGAYTEDERQELIATMRDALTDAGDRSRDPDSPTSVGERCRRLIDSSLRSGSAHVTYPGGITPAYPEAIRLGYRRISMGMTNEGETYRLEPRGDFIGVITQTKHGSRLHLQPDETVAVILSAARKGGEPMQVTKSVVQRALAGMGILRTEHDGKSWRYTVGVPDPASPGGGRLVRRWDVDADRIFFDDEPPTSKGPVGPNTYPPVGDVYDGNNGPDDEADDDMASVYEQTQHHVGETATCTRCGQDCSLYIDGICIHFPCWKATPDNAEWIDPQPESPCLGCGRPTTERFGGQPLHQHCQVTGNSPAGAPATSTAQSPTSPAAAPTPTTGSSAGSSAAGRRARTADRVSPWKHPAAVIDGGAVYTPDGQSTPVTELRTIDDVAQLAESLAVGHSAAPGLMVLTESAMTRLGLMPSMEILTAPGEDGTDPTDQDVRTRILTHLAGQVDFLATTDGWKADGRLAPWTTIRRENRAFRLVLEPFVWIWDPRADSPSPFNNLPDPTEDPQSTWTELARRLGRLTELLDLPWSTSASTTGAALVDRIQRHRSHRDGRVLDAAGVRPDVHVDWDSAVEPEYNWFRRPSAAELDKASAAHFYDRRGSYLAPAGGTDLPLGQPVMLEQKDALALVDQVLTGGGKLPAGLWQITLPAWDEPMPPPHPHQRRAESVTRWVTTPTLRLLIDDDDEGGAAYSPRDLHLDASWVWEEQARMLEPWYRQLRDALKAAREEEGRSDGPLSTAIKGVYTAYIGRMNSDLAAKGARPWHYQPMWNATIIGSARSSLWRVLRRHQLTTGRTPVVVHIDEVGYLDPDPDATTNPPAPDNGNLGKLKVSKSLPLADDTRRQLAKGTSIYDNRFWPEKSN